MSADKRLYDVAMELISPSGDRREMSKKAVMIFNESRTAFVNHRRSRTLPDGVVMERDDRKNQMNVLKIRGANDPMMVDLNENDRDEQRLQEIKSLQMNLKREQDRLAAKVNLTATITHELGNPISAIRMRTHILRTHLGEFSQAKIEQSFDQIDAHLNHIVDLLHDLMLVNQISSTETVTVTEPFHLGVFCQKMLDEMSFRWEGREVILTTKGELSRARLNQRLVRYILLNLVGNALKYSPEGGEVGLEVQVVDDTVIFSVHDQGIGISEAELPHIFTQYYRASNAGHFSGSGLGLAIMKTCIEMYGGTIAVKSRLNEGTTFTVSLPMKSN